MLVFSAIALTQAVATIFGNTARSTSTGASVLRGSPALPPILPSATANTANILDYFDSSESDASLVALMAWGGSIFDYGGASQGIISKSGRSSK
jgi:hypothetical protein